MGNKTIKEILDDLNKEERLLKLWCARRKLLKYKISAINNELKKQKTIEDLLRIKYAINMPISNIGLKTFWTIVFTVIVTEDIKWLVTKGKEMFNTIGGLIAIAVLFLVPYAIAYVISNKYYGSPIGRFKKVRKQKIITDLIDIEIEKKKKAPAKKKLILKKSPIKKQKVLKHNYKLIKSQLYYI